MSATWWKEISGAASSLGQGKNHTALKISKTMRLAAICVVPPPALYVAEMNMLQFSFCDRGQRTEKFHVSRRLIVIARREVS